MNLKNWMYNEEIPFNVVTQVFNRYLTSHVIIDPVSKPLLIMRFSVMVDGWTNKRQRPFIKFLVNSPRGSVFIESVDASEYAKTGEKMCELINKIIIKVGVENVVQVITDNASVLAGNLLETKRPHLYWTPCVVHCIDLMLEDIGKLPEMKMTLKKAISVTSFVYVRPGVVNMPRKFTEGKELCRA
ncbi:hypothetical protein ACS0TY_023829 [Phlomoides rotata]